MRFPIVLAALLLQGTASAAVRITVFHTNDIHGYTMARSSADGSYFGGAPAMAAVLAKETGPRLLLDAGDWWQGTPEGTVTQGATVAEIFNELSYDAVAIGNHEFDAGLDSLKRLIGLIKVPVLSANIFRKESDERAPWVTPWIVKEVAGIKFGLFGLTTTDMGRLAFPENIAGLRFKNEVEAAREAVAALQKEGADVIVAMTHVGLRRPGQPAYDDDEVVAKQVPGIDLIVGGHTHTDLPAGLLEPQSGTLIVQSGHYLTFLGKVTLEVDEKTKKLISKKAELIELNPAAGTDPKIQAIVVRHENEIGKKFAVVVATTTAALVRTFPGESALGNWVTDCYRDEAQTDLAMQNGGGLRADLKKGPVTMRDFFSVMPFDNRLVRLRMKGKDIRAALETAVGHRRTGQISGARVEFKADGPHGQRIVSADVAGFPLDDTAEYSVAAVDFMVAGGDHYSSFANASETIPLRKLARDAILDCAKRQRLIAPPPLGRLLAK